MANALLTVDKITKEATLLLENSLTVANKIDNHSNEFGKKDGQIGDSLRIRCRPGYDVRTGSTFSSQNVEEPYVTLNLNIKKGIDTTFTTEDLTLNIEQFSDRILRPQMSRLAAEVDAITIAEVLKKVPSTVNAATLGLDEMFQLGQKLDEQLAPQDMRNLVVNAQGEYDILKDTKGLFNSQNTIGQQNVGGKVRDIGGFGVSKSQLIPRLATGTRGNAGTVETLSVAGDTSIELDIGTGVETVKAGDVFTVANVFSVNPQTKEVYSTLKQFTAAADAVAAGGLATVNVTEAIYAAGGQKNVSALPQAGAVTAFVGALSSNFDQALAFVPEFAGIAFAPLTVPKGTDKASRESYKGVSLRYVSDYDIDTDVFKCRFDVLFGVQVKTAELAAKFIRTA